MPRPPPQAGRRQALRTLHAGALAASGLAGSACAGPAPAPSRASGPRMAAWAAPRRGFNIGVLDERRHDDAFLRDAAAHGARHVRCIVPMGAEGSRPRFEPAVRQALARVLLRAERVGLAMVLVPDRAAETNSPLWRDGAEGADGAEGRAFADAWAQLARDLRDADAVAGFDLLNEPNPPWPGNRIAASSALWETLARRTLAAIRAEDAGVPVVLEGVAGGGPQGLPVLGAWRDPALVYSLHFYVPHEITHQGVSPRWPLALRYPSDDGAASPGRTAQNSPGWNRERLRAELAPSAARGQRDGVPVYVGEFSCVRWAPGDSALNYVRDCLALFAGFGWHWAYHEFRGWPGWDAETTSTTRGLQAEPRRADAPVMSLLREAMAAPRRG
jgi:Cellulase (glycosyl hydrolase family 5)